MQTVGVYLKKGREAQNISLSDVSDYTKISKMYLDFLEKDEYSKIPAKPYVKGYISSYATFIGIDEHEALQLYESFQNETNDTEEINTDILPNKKNSVIPYLRLNKKFWIVLVFCILSILAICAYYSFLPDQTKATAKVSLEEQNSTLQSTLNPAIKPEFKQKSEDNKPFPAEKQTGFDKKTESREVRKTQDDDISLTPGPLANQKPEESSKKAELSTQNNEVSKAKELPASDDDNAIIENSLTSIEVSACTGIENRIPQGIGNTFKWSTDRIYIWSRIKSESPPSSIKHIYYFKGEKINNVKLKIRSSNWRTWSYKTLANKRYIGQWRVDVTSAEGKILNSINFEIK